MPEASRKIPSVTARPDFTIDHRVGLRISERRNQCGLSQAALGEQLGIEAKFVMMIETGQLRPTPGQFLQMARVLATPLTYFFANN